MLVSIIVPVYNAEKYLNKCINSVIGQTLSFEKNIELVLVNDGSSDGSGEICESYAAKYPENVIYYEQPNGGVSAARNKGLELATGKIIGFIDADDFLSRNAVAAIWKYFRIAHEIADVAVIKVLNFGARNAPHYSNGKFKAGTQTLDLREPKWFDVCTRVGHAFFLAETVKRHSFDKTVTFFEDAKFINEVLAEKMRLGVVHEGVYYYRRYPNESDEATSLTIGAAKNKRFYLETPEKVSLYLLSRDYGTEAPLYFQYVALSEMRWRTFYNKVQASQFLSAEEYASYCELNDKILAKISDEAILTYNLYNFWQKVYLLNMKHKKNILEEARFEDSGELVWNGYVLFNTEKNLNVNLSDIIISKKQAFVEGYFLGFVDGEIKVYARANGEPLETKVEIESVDATAFPLEHKAYKHSAFSVAVPLDKSVKIDFAYEINGVEHVINRLGISRIGNIDHVHSPIQVRGGRIIRRSKRRLEILAITPVSVAKLFVSISRLLKKKANRAKIKQYATKLIKGRKK